MPNSHQNQNNPNQPFLDDAQLEENRGRFSNERFELRDAPGPGGQTIGKFATREAADKALIDKRNENPSLQHIVVDMGVRAGDNTGNREEYVEAAKSADQKVLEKAQGEDKADPTRLSTESPYPTHQ